MQVIGFVSQAIPENPPEGFREEDSILVYLPLSYMIGGYAVLIPRSAVRPLKISMGKPCVSRLLQALRVRPGDPNCLQTKTKHGYFNNNDE